MTCMCEFGLNPKNPNSTQTMNGLTVSPTGTENLDWGQSAVGRTRE